jgi:predicted nucleic acid-binding protein
VLAEYAEVLARPRFRFDQARVREVLIKLEADGVAVDATGERNLAVPDPDDEPFLGLALAGQVDYLVTGNLSDYPVERRRECAVVNPAEFMRAWRRGEQSRRG